jgi:8-oxo-dGTP diphosphatase
VTVFFIRHAKAGSRSKWDGPDERRPLTKNGRAQAEELAKRLKDRPITRIVSSPYVRCVQTVEPLAGVLGLSVEIDLRLTEGAGYDGALALLAELADDAVLCSHGDVLPATLDALSRRGMETSGPGDIRKGVTWVLERADGEFTHGRAVPPPGRDEED